MIQFKFSFLQRDSLFKKFIIFSIISSVMLVIIFDSNFLMGFVKQKVFPLDSKITVFSVYVFLYAILGLVLLIWTYRFSYLKDIKYAKIYFVSIFIIYLVLSLSLLITLLQILYLKSYSNMIFYLSSYISLVVSLGFLTALSFKFCKWYLKGKNKFILLYTVLFSIYSFSLLLGLLYIVNGLATHPSTIYPTSSRELRAGTFSIDIQLQNNIALYYDIFFIISFMLAWILTVLMLKQYVPRIGKYKFWILVSLPLFFYLTRYEGLILNYFNVNDFLNLPSLGKIYPSIGDAIYVAFINSNIQAAGVFFGLSFLAILIKLKNSQLQNEMLITITGMMILFASRDFHAIFLNSLPPNGVVTVSFMVIGSFMLFIGITSFLKLAIRDKEFYKDLMTKIETDIQILKDIIITEKEMELHKKIKPLLDYSNQWQAQHKYSFKNIDEITEIIEDVISDYQKKKVQFNPNRE